jgi:peptide/nickel transport system substrate-binding protein
MAGVSGLRTVGLGVVVLLAVACGGGSTAARAPATPSTGSPSPSVTAALPASGGRVTVALSQPIAGWNPHSLTGSTASGIAVAEQVYPSVFTLRPDGTGATLDTALVTSARRSPGDPEVVTYTINPDARWSDGVPITATDFRYLWRVSNGRACPSCAVASTAGYADITSISGSDQGRTVSVTFAQPFSDWMSLFGGGYGLLPAHVAARHGSLAKGFAFLNRHPATVSGGPFRVLHAEPTAVSLAPNPRYYGPAPLLHRLDLVVVGSAVRQVADLAADDVDVVSPPATPAVVRALRSDPISDVDVSVKPGLDTETLLLNLHTSVFADRALRLALLTIVDRQRLISGGVAAVAAKTAPVDNRFFGPGQPGYRDDVTSTGLGSGDLKRAQSDLDGAGYRGLTTRLDSPTGHRLPVLVLRYPVGDELAQTEGEAVASDARRLGISIEVAPWNASKDLSSASRSVWDLAIAAAPGGVFPTHSTSQAFITGSADNIGGYSNPQVDRFLRAARVAASPQAETAADDAADLVISQDGYTLPLYRIPVLLAVNRGVRNVVPDVTPQGPAYDAATWGAAAR